MLFEHLLTCSASVTSSFLYAWGSNLTGQLRINNFVDLSTPTTTGMASWSKFVAGAGHNFGITSGNQLYAWGYNGDGQLGIGKNWYAISSPVAVAPGGSASWLSVGIGLSHVVAVRGDGGLFTQGLNSSGQLGDNTTISKSSYAQTGTAYANFRTTQLGTDYYLSKRTNVYAIYGQSIASNISGSTLSAASQNGYSLGLRHTF